MIAADTHVLIRLLIADDASQAAKARQVFDEAAERNDRIWVSDTVLVELAWTLGRAYGCDRSDIVKTLRALAPHATVALQSPAAVHSATDAFKLGPADFADGLMSMKAAAAGCDGVVTFDRGIKGLPGEQVL